MYAELEVIMHHKLGKLRRSLLAISKIKVLHRRRSVLFNTSLIEPNRSESVTPGDWIRVIRISSGCSDAYINYHKRDFIIDYLHRHR